MPMTVQWSRTLAWLKEHSENSFVLFIQEGTKNRRYYNKTLRQIKAASGTRGRRLSYSLSATCVERGLEIPDTTIPPLLTVHFASEDRLTEVSPKSVASNRTKVRISRSQEASTVVELSYVHSGCGD